MDKMRQIVRKTTSDEKTGLVRSVFVWKSSGVEILEGLYVAKVKNLKRKSSPWGKLPVFWKKEVLIWKSQEEGEIHQMIIKNKLVPPDLGEFCEPEGYFFQFIEEYIGKDAWEYLFSR